MIETSDISINSPGASLVALHGPSPDRWPTRRGSLRGSGRYSGHPSTHTRHRRRTDGSRSHSAPSHRHSTPTLPTRHGTGSTAAASRPGEPSYTPSPARCQSPRPAPASPGRSDQCSSCHSPTDRASNSQRAHRNSRPTRPTELQLSLRGQGGSLRSPRAARPPGRACAPVSAPLQPGRRPCRALSNEPLTSEKGYVAAGAVSSTALRSHFGASLEDHGPNVVLYRAGPQIARRAASLRGHEHSRQSSSADPGGTLRRRWPWAKSVPLGDGRLGHWIP
ncbi:hypothetical protein QFZ74_002859 [Streptomyces sp. V3I7]|nr:hypothetical protein [Streptomyces sp. V3I7]